MLKDVTGMAAVSLAPMAGAQGEFAGVAMIRAYHERARRRGAQRNHSCRTRRTAPTRPPPRCAATRCAKSRPTATATSTSTPARRGRSAHRGPDADQPVDARRVRAHIVEIRDIVHEAGGLLYYDGANLNAILGKVKPGDMGFDVIHMNLHKTFSTPHGGGGPGAGPVGVARGCCPSCRFRWSAEGKGAIAG